MALVACGGDDGTSGVDPVATGEPELTATPDARDFPDPVLRVRERAAEDAGVPLDEVAIFEYAEEVWPSTALGCPQPGTYYAQVMTPGYRVVIHVGAEAATYHTDMQSTIVRCES
jgi:hypothetical protein